MTEPASPLSEGTLVGERFLIESLLGRGGFGITYLVWDTERRDRAVLKELAPLGTKRESSGVLSFAVISQLELQRLRHQFVNEARLLSRLNIRGVLPVRAAFEDYGTSFFVSEYIESSLSLQRTIQRDGRMSSAAALNLFQQLLQILGEVHAKGILHRDIKPSNILLVPSGIVYLIDFGSARAWHADVAHHHTIEHTPGYAPIEQMSERARRGPGTDLYALCATMYEVLSGFVPPSAADRVAGVELTRLEKLRPDIPMNFAQAIFEGLAIRLDQRPQTCADMVALLHQSESPPPSQPRYELLDGQILELRTMRVGKRECPACSGVLGDPVPLGPNVCPVCRDGTIRSRNLNDRLCPNCRVGILSKVSNADPLAFCPTCRVGRLSGTGILAGIGSRKQICDACGEKYISRSGTMTRSSDGNSASPMEWRESVDRSSEVWVCDGCNAQFDSQPDGRREQILPKPKSGGYKIMYPDEWARVAAGYEPTVGNAHCNVCDADFFLEGEVLTALSAPRDPFGYMGYWGGQAIRVADVQWLGAGKSSGRPGLLCKSCDLEFDHENDQLLSLIGSSAARLNRHVSESHPLFDWHCLAKRLPIGAQAESLEHELALALADAIVSGELAFSSQNKNVLWSGSAEVLDADNIVVSLGKHPLLVTDTELILGGLLKKVKLPLHELVELDVDEEDDGALILDFGGGKKLEMFVETVHLEVKLRSGKRLVELDSSHLATILVHATTQP